MPLTSEAQIMAEIVCEEPASSAHPEVELVLEPIDEHELIVSEEPSKEEVAFEVEAPHSHEDGKSDDDLEIVIDELPGAPAGTPDPELEVSEDDVNSAKDKKKGKWDWDLEGFFDWVKERLDGVPSHSGYSVSGLERAIEYMERLDNEISKAMKSDLDGTLDSDKIEQLREQIEDGIERLTSRMEKVKKSPKRKKEASEDAGMVKEGQKAPGMKGVMVTVPLLISSLARILVNGSVSGGHSMEDMFHKLASKYKLDDREKLELVQLLSDMNYPIKLDRGVFPDELDPRSSDNFDLSAIYHG